MDGQLLEDVRFLGVKVEPHLREPLEAAGVGDLVGYEHPRGVSLVDQLRDLWGSGEEREEMKILNNNILVDINHTILPSYFGAILFAVWAILRTTHSRDTNFVNFVVGANFVGRNHTLCVEKQISEISPP